MRVLITGSRTWYDAEGIRTAFEDYLDDVDPENVTVVSGSCPYGADRLCETYALSMGYTVERHPAEWERYGQRAGFIRNAEMVSLGADLCLAFIKGESKGATMTADLAVQSGIETIIYRS